MIYSANSGRPLTIIREGRFQERLNDLNLTPASPGQIMIGQIPTLLCRFLRDLNATPHRAVQRLQRPYWSLDQSSEPMSCLHSTVHIFHRCRNLMIPRFTVLDKTTPGTVMITWITGDDLLTKCRANAYYRSDPKWDNRYVARVVLSV